MHLILTGATGLVGSAVLHTMLTTPSISKISILSRRPVAQAEGHEKAHVIIHKDFSVYDKALMQELKDAKGVVWAQGISAIGVTKSDYEQITLEYPTAFAKALATTIAPEPVNFIYVSGEGATTTPGFLTQHWCRIKGITESTLLSLLKDPQYKNLRPISLRPAGVEYSTHTDIHQYAPQMGSFKVGMNAVIKSVLPSFSSPTEELGRVLVDLAMGNGKEVVIDGKQVEGEGRTVRNTDMRKLATLKLKHEEL